MKLSDVPFDKLKVGDKLISAVGQPGKITKLTDKEFASQQEDNEIEVEWDSGKTSKFWHFWGGKVTYAE